MCFNCSEKKSKITKFKFPLSRSFNKDTNCSSQTSAASFKSTLILLQLSHQPLLSAAGSSAPTTTSLQQPTCCLPLHRKFPLYDVTSGNGWKSVGRSEWWCCGTAELTDDDYRSRRPTARLSVVVVEERLKIRCPVEDDNVSADVVISPL